MEIKVYETSGGRQPLYDFIRELPSKHQKKIIKKVENLEKYGLSGLLRTADAKKLKGCDHLYELIVNYHNSGYRIFLAIINDAYWLLHIFQKKSQKTPLKEIKLSLSRKKELELKINL